MICYVLHNPFAGRKGAESPAWLTTIADTYTVTKYDITAISKDYSAFFASLAKDDIVVLHGGDGTLNRFINDTDGMNIEQDILYAPGGTGNDFLRDLDKSADAEPFSVRSYIKNLPFVEVQGKRYRFLNNVGFGIDGYCCEVGDAQKKAAPEKPVNYTAIAIKGLLFHYKPTTATVVVDGQEYVYKNVWVAGTMKGRFYGGGMNATPAQNRLDPEGKISIMMFYGKNRLATLIAFPAIFKGEHIKNTKRVTIHTGNEISVKFDSPRSVQIDGETILGVTEYRAYSANGLKETTSSAEAALQA